MTIHQECSPSDFLSHALVADYIAIDTETTGLNLHDGRDFAIGISACVRIAGVYDTAYFPVAHSTDNVDRELQDMLRMIMETKPVLFHNAKFDLVSLSTIPSMKGLNLKRWYCTMLMAHMLNENVPKGLDWLAKNYLHVSGKAKSPEFELMSKIFGWPPPPTFPAVSMASYATQDAYLTYCLFEELYPHFKDSKFDGDSV